LRHGWHRDPIGFRRCWISRGRVGTCSRTHRCGFPAACLAAVTANLGSRPQYPLGPELWGWVREHRAFSGGIHQDDDGAGSSLSLDLGINTRHDQFTCGALVSQDHTMAARGSTR
jgi:hypothetical protein